MSEEGFPHRIDGVDLQHVLIVRPRQFQHGLRGVPAVAVAGEAFRIDFVKLKRKMVKKMIETAFNSMRSNIFVLVE